MVAKRGLFTLMISRTALTAPIEFCKLDHWLRAALTDQPSKLHRYEVEKVEVSALCDSQQTQIVAPQIKPHSLA